MIDESMDKEQLKKPAEPWEFRAKPAWQRLIIMVGGVVVNVPLLPYVARPNNVGRCLRQCRRQVEGKFHETGLIGH